MSLHVNISTTDEHLGDMHITRIADGVDGIHSYRWEWGVNIAGHYVKIDEGEVQHRESDGAFALMETVIKRIRSHK